MDTKEMIKCEDVVLEFLKKHPDVTVMLQYDAAAKSWVVGMNRSKSDFFRKVCFLINCESKHPHEELHDRMNYEYETRMKEE